MKKDIRYTWIGHYPPFITLATDGLDKNYNFIPDQIEPDYIFVDSDIFFRPYLMKELYSYKKEKDKKYIFIFVATECITPDFNIFDYAISFNDDIIIGDRYIRIPPFRIFKTSPSELDKLPENPKQCLSEKTKFCNFIYSNPTAHPMRDELFHKISEYKRVDSLGPHLNNCENPSPRASEGWQLASIELKRPYKFSIAAENATSSGYASEKIMTSFQAHSIPIYWGNPNITRDFNPKSFINCHDYPDLDAVCARIQEIDNNDALWLEIMNQPRRTKEQIELHNQDLKDFESFMKNIFDQDIQNAWRAPRGFWPQTYETHLFAYFNDLPEIYTPIWGGLIKKAKYRNKRKIILFNFIKFSYTSNKSKN